MGGRDLHRAGAELHLAVFVPYDGDLPVDEGQDHGLADDVRIPGVLRVHGDGRIAQHGLGAGGGHGDGIGLVRGIVADVPEMARLSLILHLRVTERGLAVRAPVDDAVAPIDELFVVKGLEDLKHGLVAALVHGEALPVPIAGGAHLPKLLHDGGAIFLPPLPGPLQKALPAHVLLGEAFSGQSFHDLNLGGDGGVVCAREPQHLIARHALIAGDGVLQGVVEGVAHMELARDVGGRDHDGEGRLVRVRFSVEVAVLLPLLIPFVLHDLMIVGLRHLFHLFLSL